MIDVYDYLNMVNDLSGAIVRLFNCNSGEVVFDSTNRVYDDPVDDIEEKGFGYCDVVSVDIYKDSNGSIVLELNIEIEDEDE